MGPALLPEWSNPYEGPRYLSDDGSRLFFETYDRLLPADESPARDVYEFELPGAGSCTQASASYDPASGGCHFLISSGTSDEQSRIVDASANGRDIFLSTRSVLTGWDVNENYDVYGARVGGGFPEPAPERICQGEACVPPVGPAPSQPSAATPGVQNAGNPPARKPKTHKHRKRHRHKKSHAKAKHKRGAER